MDTAQPCRRRSGRASPERRSLRAGLAWTGLVLLLASFPLAAQWPRVHPRMLLVTQTHDAADGPGIQSATLATIGFAREALITLPSSETVPGTAGSASLIVARIDADATPSQVLAIAARRYADQAPALAARMAAWLRSLGAARGVFILEQSTALPTTGASEPQRLIWTLTVDAQGRFLHSAPRLHTGRPFLLHVRYVPRQLASGLPAQWTYLDSGRLHWQRVSLQLQPLAPPQSIDTGGAFDAPSPSAGAAQDPDAGLACLIDRRARPDCPAGLPDVVGLIDTQGASWALVDYARELQPVYDLQVAADGGVEQVARAGLAVRRREVSRGDCTSGARFRNSGQLGVLLEALTDRIHVTPDGRSAPIARLRDSWMSPVHEYDHTRPVSDAGPTALSPYIIDPLAPQSPLLVAASVPGLRELAPVDAVGTDPAAHARWRSAPGGIARIDIEVTCPEPGRWVARATISPWTRCYGGGCNSTYLPRELTFARGRAAIADWAWTAYTYRGQPWEPQRIDYDGADTLSFRHIAGDGCGSPIAVRLNLVTGAHGVDPPPPCDSD